MICKKDTDALRDRVRGYMDAHRYSHTLGVEREVRRLGELFFSDDTETLAAAALLHDITKSESAEKQLQYCSEFGIIVEDFDKSSPALLHAVTGAALISRDFPEFADERVVSAVRWHTTGRAGMSVFDTLLFLADYIEEGRAYADCVRVGEYFWGAAPASMTEKERLCHLWRTVVRVCENTVTSLERSGRAVDEDTVRCGEYFKILLKIHTPTGV